MIQIDNMSSYGVSNPPELRLCGLCYSDTVGVGLGSHMRSLFAGNHKSAERMFAQSILESNEYIGRNNHVMIGNNFYSKEPYFRNENTLVTSRTTADFFQLLRHWKMIDHIPDRFARIDNQEFCKVILDDALGEFMLFHKDNPALYKAALNYIELTGYEDKTLLTQLVPGRVLFVGYKFDSKFTTLTLICYDLEEQNWAIYDIYLLYSMIIVGVEVDLLTEILKEGTRILKAKDATPLNV